MTQEQIKQAASEYADKMEPLRRELQWVATRDDFIAGAHSRDGEIKQLIRCIAFAVGVIIGFVGMLLITAL